MVPEEGAGADWRRIALTPRRAHGDPLARGLIRVAPEDFTVEERLGFEPDGGTAHRFLWVEKREVTTLDVARTLAEAIGCPPMDIGYAGLKDRRAVARQWFSAPANGGQLPAAGAVGRGFRVLAVHPHSRKLRRGSLAGNSFRLHVRTAGIDPAALAARLAAIAGTGFPNYFGPQRFGVEGRNLTRIADWIGGARMPRARDARSFLLSSARALAFNAVLERRVEDGSWQRLLPGEIVSLAGSASVFPAETIDATLAARCRSGDVSPSGPLCGAGGLQPIGEAGASEAQALSALAPIPALLTQGGMRGDRRPLVARPSGLQYRQSDAALELAFALPRGAYATCLLRELIEVDVPDADLD